MPVFDGDDSSQWPDWLTQLLGGVAGPAPGGPQTPQTQLEAQLAAGRAGLQPPWASGALQPTVIHLGSGGAANLVHGNQAPQPPMPPMPPTINPLELALMRRNAGGGPQPGPGNVPVPPGPLAPQASPLAGQRGIGSDVNFPVLGAGGMPTTWAAPGQQLAPSGPPPGPLAVNPNVPAPNAQPMSATAPTAAAAAPGVNPRFVQIDRPNAPAGFAGRGGGGPPQMTALNLAGLFGRNQGQAATPANLPTPAAQPVSGALAPPATRAPWAMGPLQSGFGWPSGTPFGPNWPPRPRYAGSGAAAFPVG